MCMTFHFLVVHQCCNSDVHFSLFVTQHLAILELLCNVLWVLVECSFLSGISKNRD